MTTVIAPVEGFTGTVAGVEFQDGRAETDDPRALAYFRRRSYLVDGERTEREPAPEPPDPRDVTVQHGPKLRDASVDPSPDDRRVVFPVRTGPDGVPRRTPPDDAA